jgi:V8-like Glu-specific endopeptidase
MSKATARYKPTHDDTSPLFPDEVARLENIAATAALPDDIARRFSTPNVVVSTKNKKFESGARFARLKGIEGAFELREPEGLIVGIPGRTGERLASKKVASQVAPGNTTPAHRPPWVSQVFHPRPSILPHRPLLRTTDGRRVEPFYGVFGSEDRQVYYPSGYPWRCIGRIFTWTDASTPSWKFYGSGVLVGPRHVLCAGHMAPWGSNNWMMKFVPSYYDGVSLDGPGVLSYVSDYWGYNDGQNVTAWDMLLLRLYTPLGDQLGYFGSKTYNPAWDNQPYWELCGYPSVITPERPSYQLGISVLDHDNSGDAMQLEHQGDLTGGDSGGPFFSFWPDGFPYVVATNSGGEAISGSGAEDNNIGAGGKAIVDLIKWGLANWT